MAPIPLLHWETDHPCCSCISVCQLDKWPVRVAVMYWLPPSACLSLSLTLSSHSASFLSIFISPMLLPSLPVYFQLFPFLSLSLCPVSPPSFLLPLIESSLPQRALISVYMALSAIQMAGSTQFGIHCVLGVFLPLLFAFSPSLLGSR